MTSAIQSTETLIPERLQTQTVVEKNDARTDFLQLLVAQMQHQDPLQPQDGTEFMQQLATLTQVEQSAATNTKLDGLLDAELATGRASLVGMVGHDATAAISTVAVPLPAGAKLYAQVPSDAADVKVEVKDPTSGNVIRTIDIGELDKGDFDLDLGQPALTAGKYTIEVKGTVAGKKDTSIPTALSGQVTKLEMAGGVLNFFIGDNAISPTNILSIGE